MADIQLANRYWPAQHLDDAEQGDDPTFRLEGWTAYLDESYPWPIPPGRELRQAYRDRRVRTMYKTHPRSGETAGYLLLKGHNRTQEFSSWERIPLVDGALELKAEAGISGEASREAFRTWGDGYVWMPAKIRGNTNRPAKRWINEFVQRKYANCDDRDPIEVVDGLTACEIWGPFGLHREDAREKILGLLDLPADWGALAVDSIRGLPVSLGKPHVQPWATVRLEYWGDRPGQHTTPDEARNTPPDQRSSLFQHLEIYLSARAGNDGLGRVGWIKCERAGDSWVRQRVTVADTVVWDRVKPFPHCVLDADV